MSLSEFMKFVTDCGLFEAGLHKEEVRSVRAGALRRDWARPAPSCPGSGLTPRHICTGTDLTICHVRTGTGLTPRRISGRIGLLAPAASAPARPFHVCARTGLTPPVGAPSRAGCGSAQVHEVFMDANTDGTIEKMRTRHRGGVRLRRTP
jgi:hypothetical protein